MPPQCGGWLGPSNSPTSCGTTTTPQPANLSERHQCRRYLCDGTIRSVEKHAVYPDATQHIDCLLSRHVVKGSDSNLTEKTGRLPIEHTGLSSMITGANLAGTHVSGLPFKPALAETALWCRVKTTAFNGWNFPYLGAQTRDQNHGIWQSLFILSVSHRTGTIGTTGHGSFMHNARREI